MSEGGQRGGAAQAAGAALGAAALGAAGLGAAYWACMSPNSQLLGEFPFRAEGAGRSVALTFDDGPNEPFTTQIAEYLEERDIRGTFFQVGRAVLERPDVTARLASRGHVIGNHGYTHEFTNYLTPATLAADVRQGQQALISAGVRPGLYRPPWLLRIPALRTILGEHGLRIISGEFCHAMEVFQPAPERIARRALAKIGPGSIVIFHDGFDGRGGNRASTVRAVQIVVDRLLDAGYGFTTVDRLLGIPAYQPDPV